MSKALEPKNDISINLNCYTIRFKKKFTADNFIKVQDAFDNKIFQEIIQKFITELDMESYVNETKDRLLYIEKSLNFTNSIYTGVIRKGHSGHETNIDEIKAKKANTINTITVGQFSTIPFFILLSQPVAGSKVIIFIAQSYKQFGFKEIFEAAFVDFYKKHFNKDKITCEFGTLSIAKLFEQYVNDGSIRNLRFIKHMLTKNLENLIDGDNDDKDPKSYKVQLSVASTTKGFMGIKQNIKVDNSSFMELYKIDGFEYDEVVADVTLAGRTRVLNISKPSDFCASYDATDAADVNPDTNHPNFDKLSLEAMNILKEDIIPNITQ
jgi:hypothetical protein